MTSYLGIIILWLLVPPLPLPLLLLLLLCFPSSVVSYCRCPRVTTIGHSDRCRHTKHQETKEELEG